MPQIKELTQDEQRAIDHVRTRFYWQHHNELTILAEHQGMTLWTLARDIGQIEAMFAVLQDQTRVLPIYLMSTLRQQERDALEDCMIARAIGRWS